MTSQAQVATQTPASALIGAFLVSGTCIGGGMLVLPVQTSFAGFWLSALGLVICWAFMTYTGLLLAEATLWIRNESHFASLSRILIGRGARILSLIIYLFMNYASLVAYTSGGADLFNLFSTALFGHELSYGMNCLLFTLFFGTFVYFGAHFIGRMNVAFVTALALAYFGLVAYGSHQISLENLAFRPAWGASTQILSMILATFSYQMIVPSLCHQMQYDPRLIRKAILWGTTIPLIVYIVWIGVIHGAVPLEGPHGLREAWTLGISATKQLQALSKNTALTLLSNVFAFIAIVTSYFGLSLALFYFLKDCLNELKVNLSRFSIVLGTIVPTLLLALFFPRALLQCLDISGGFGDTVLSGLLPIAMVWMGRYRAGYTSSYYVPGGKPALLLSAAFYLYIFAIQFVSLL